MLATLLLLALQGDAEARYLDGLRAIDAGRPAVALEHARTVLMKDARRAEFWELAARAYWAGGQPGDALAPAERALELDPGNLGALWVRAHLRDAGAAVEDFTRLLEGARDRAPALRGRSRAWLALGMLELAAADLQAAQDDEEKKRRDVIRREIERLGALIAACRDDPKLYLERGEKYLIIGQGGEAAQDAAAALELDAKCVDALRLRARAYALQSRWDRAAEDVTKLIDLEGDRIPLYLQRAGYYAAANQFDKAIEDCGRAIKLDSLSTDSWIRRGMIRMAKDDVDTAVEDLTEALNINPRLTEAWVQRGLARIRQKRPDEAASDFTQALGLNPRSSEACLHRSTAHEQLGKWREALTDLDKAIELAPTLGKHKHIRDRRAALLKKLEE